MRFLRILGITALLTVLFLALAFYLYRSMLRKQRQGVPVTAVLRNSEGIVRRLCNAGTHRNGVQTVASYCLEC